MTTSKQDDAQSQPGEVRSSDQLGLVPERAQTSDTWPIVKLTVAADGHIAGASFYTPGLPPGVHDLWCVPVTAAEEVAELRAEVEAWQKQCDRLTHQVICCGVAASHPDATLTTRGAYAGKWNSAQAEEVRKLRIDRDRLRAALADVVDTDWAFLGTDADTGNPSSLYSRVRRGRQALKA